MKPAANAVVFHQRKVLLLLRGLSAPWAPGRWALPGGYLNPGETPLRAVLRELYEETGLRTPLFVQGPFAPPGANPQNSLFLVGSPTADIHLLDGEHDAYRWVDRRQLPCYALASGVGTLIEWGILWQAKGTSPPSRSN